MEFGLTLQSKFKRVRLRSEICIHLHSQTTMDIQPFNPIKNESVTLNLVNLHNLDEWSNKGELLNIVILLANQLQNDLFYPITGNSLSQGNSQQTKKE